MSKPLLKSQILLLLLIFSPLAMPKPTILFVGIKGFPIIDKIYAEKLSEEGFNILTSTIEDLTVSSLQKCNVLVLTQFSVGNTFLSEEMENAISKWVKEGGGLFLIMGLQGYGDYKELVDNLNSFLAPFDIKLLFENVKDEKHKEVFKGILNYVYYKTANILNQHPVTAGIKYIWYPGGGGQHASPISTYTFKASSSWEILIRGEKTAFSPSYPSEPPLLACRDFGKGRIAFLSMDARYFINDGYHPAYGGYAMEKGDGFRLLLQIYNWLAEPSLKQGRIFSHFSLPSQQPTKAVKEEKPPEDATCGELIRKINDVQLLKTFKGVIGVHSDLSDGENCVEELCVEAKRLGLDFLVFTERYDWMNEIKWNELVRRCKAQSTNSFIAIPGLKLTTPDAEIICFHLSRFPKVDEVTNPPALLFNLNFPTIVICKPHLNHLNPWQYKFYTGIALFTYEKGSLLDEATSLYTGNSQRMTIV